MTTTLKKGVTTHAAADVVSDNEGQRLLQHKDDDRNGYDSYADVVIPPAAIRRPKVLRKGLCWCE